MTFIPGICFCVAPGMSSGVDVLYTLRPAGFQLGTNTNLNEVFRRESARSFGGSEPLGGSGASVRADGPVAKIDFLLSAPSIGEHLASPTNPGRCTGFMANANYTGGDHNRHRYGEGRFFITSKEIAERIMSMVVPGIEIKNAGLGTNSQEWATVFDNIRGSGSNTADWLSNLQAALLGSINHVAIAYLIFRERR
ncbi:MAG: hypothetical protein GY947_11505 [Rhodobacteraceae bacterium]|nr:hypothetical protein [Paracoccaceae bacterium]